MLKKKSLQSTEFAGTNSSLINQSQFLSDSEENSNDVLKIDSSNRTSFNKSVDQSVDNSTEISDDEKSIMSKSLLDNVVSMSFTKKSKSKKLKTHELDNTLNDSIKTINSIEKTRISEKRNKSLVTNDDENDVTVEFEVDVKPEKKNKKRNKIKKSKLAENTTDGNTLEKGKVKIY